MVSDFFATLENDPNMKEMMVTYGKMCYCQNISNPFAVLCKMDLEGGKLNYEVIELLQELEADGENC
jgi:uncharacterized protein YuzB (UPF0349 family)